MYGGMRMEVWENGNESMGNWDSSSSTSLSLFAQYVGNSSQDSYRHGGVCHQPEVDSDQARGVAGERCQRKGLEGGAA